MDELLGGLLDGDPQVEAHEGGLYRARETSRADVHDVHDDHGDLLSGFLNSSYMINISARSAGWVALPPR